MSQPHLFCLGLYFVNTAQDIKAENEDDLEKVLLQQSEAILNHRMKLFLSVKEFANTE